MCNPGQTLNAVFVAGGVVVMHGTGLIMRWYGAAPSFRSGASFFHDVRATALVVVKVGHVMVALAHPDALRSMWTGGVSEARARQHGPEGLETFGLSLPDGADRPTGPRDAHRVPQGFEVHPTSGRARHSGPNDGFGRPRPGRGDLHGADVRPGDASVSHIGFATKFQ
jgi:hypothetical protein